jgi:histidinol-phosphate phosphatase family protein
MARPAVFLDRDGTIIDDVGYVGSPDQVQLLPGAAEGIRRLREAGYLAVIVSNQSGVARGLFDEAALREVHARVEALLQAEGAALDGAYYCPYLDGPEAIVPRFAKASDLRKPAPGMILQAASELGIDRAASWMIGDSERDVQAGERAGCRTVLIASNGAAEAGARFGATYVANDLNAAADLVLGGAARARSSPTASAPVPATHPEGQLLEVSQALSRIENQLDRMSRRDRQDDFSFLRLAATLVQMFAILAGLWGGAAMLADEPGAAATPRLALACFLQLVALSGFVLDRNR